MKYFRYAIAMAAIIVSNQTLAGTSVALLVPLFLQ